MPTTTKAERAIRRAVASDPALPISIIRVRKESDDTLHILVTVELDRGRKKTLVINHTDSLVQITKSIASVSEDLSRDPKTAQAQIAKCIAAAPAGTKIGVEFPGWKNGQAYVTDQLRRGHGWDEYVWMGAPLPHTTCAAGTLWGWRWTVAAACAESSYLAFALLVALAGPVLYWADLPEGAVFHFAGKSSTGKTTTARVAASVDGDPGSYASWNQSDRRIGETTAERRDRVANLNAAEKAKLKDMREILQAMTHGLTEGGGKVYSAAVKATLPDLFIRSPILSNGNRSGAEMARMVGLAWDEQEAARFITIPVPTRKEGGVVDRPKGTGPDYSAELIKRLEKGLKRNHGRVLSRWLDHVWTHRKRVNGLIVDFVDAVGPADAYEHRIALKFGLVYAAGRIAVETGFLPWKWSLPLRVVRHLYQRALSALQVGCPREALLALDDALRDPEVFPDIGSGKELRLGEGNRFVGFRFSRGGQVLVAIRQEALSLILEGITEPEVLIGALEQAGVLEGGHGGRTGQQVRVSIVSRTAGRIEKPRCLVMKETKLEEFLHAAGAGHAGREDAIRVI